MISTAITKALKLLPWTERMRPEVGEITEGKEVAEGKATRSLRVGKAVRKEAYVCAMEDIQI